MIAAALLGALLWWRGTLFETRWYLRAMAQCWWIGFVAVIAGWVVTESGRQPWIVYGIMRTADATSPVPAASIAGTLALFVVVYGIVFWFGIYYINRLIAQGPTARSAEEAGQFAQPPRTMPAAALAGAQSMEWYLPVIWAAVIGTAVAMYVILDGFDLGIGILFPFARSEGERDQMMRSVAPFWDGNETWLVLGGAGLFVAFPRAYAVIMPAFYLPVIVMLLALVFRGVAFEFRTVSHSKTWWSVAFTGGSTLAAFRAGRDPGRADRGRSGARRRLCRRAVRLGDAVRAAVRAGAGRRLRLARRHLAGDEDRRAGRRARARASARLLLAVLVFMAAVSLWTPLA